MAVGVDFAFELLDRYMCKFFVMFFPHAREDEFMEAAELGCMKFFVGGLRYLEARGDFSKKTPSGCSRRGLVELCMRPMLSLFLCLRRR